ncbi:rRNA maturation RNase YbeY [Chloroflexota bacterium]
MTVFLNIADQYSDFLNSSHLERSVLAALNHQGVSPDSDLTILVDDDQRIQKLNYEYLSIDAPTDVLAFPAGFSDPDTGHTYLGDVIISFPQAKSQANKQGHPLEAEIQLLVVHGVLHLLGFDHLESEDKEIMWSAQSQILNQLKVQISVPE